MRTFANIGASILSTSRHGDTVKDLARKGVSLVAEHGDAILQVVRDCTSGEAISSLCNGKLAVSQEAIRLEIERVEWLQPYLRELICGVDGISLHLQCKCYGGLLAAQIRLRVNELILAAHEQKVILNVVEERYCGLNLWGKALLRLCMIVANDPLRYVLQESLSAQGLKTDSANRVISIDLGGVKAIQRLLEPMLTQWPGSIPLSLIGVEGCDHVVGGILVKMRAFPGITL